MTETTPEGVPEFDAYNDDHVRAYRKFCKKGIWPDDCDISDRYLEPCWVILVQSRLADRCVNLVLGHEKENKISGKAIRNKKTKV